MQHRFEKLSPRFNQGFSGQSLFTITAMGISNSTPPVLSNGQSSQFQLDPAGNVFIALPYLYKNVAAGQATTVIKSGAGFLHAITFNSAASASSTLIMYDNTAASGTKIATITATGLTPPLTVKYDVAFTVGLTIITGTANGADMTFSYR